MQILSHAAHLAHGRHWAAFLAVAIGVFVAVGIGGWVAMFGNPKDPDA
jgi:hypothetical protein